MIRLIRLGTQDERPPLFAIPGIDGSIGSLEAIIRQIAEKREVIAVDYSGETSRTLEGLSAEIAQAIKAEGRASFDLFGQSIGTVLAAQLASDHGLPVRKVALACSFTQLHGLILRVMVLTLRLTPRWLARLNAGWSLAVLCGPVGDGRDSPAFKDAQDADQAGVAKRTTWEIDRDFALDLVKIKLPLLVLMGEQDRFVPNTKREVEKLPTLFAGQDARIETIPNAGHIFLPSAAVALAAEKINAFLET